MKLYTSDYILLLLRYQNLNSGTRRMNGLNSSSAAVGRLGPSGDNITIRGVVSTR